MSVTIEPTVADLASTHWSKVRNPCLNCCGPWVSELQLWAREAALDTDPIIGLSGDDPPFQSRMVISLGGCAVVCIDEETCDPVVTEEDRDACLAPYDAAITAAEAVQSDEEDDLTDATAALGVTVTALSTAQSEVDTAYGVLATARSDYHGMERDYLAALVRQETALRRGDTAGAADAVDEQNDITAALAVHSYHTALSDYLDAVAAANGAQADVFQAILVVVASQEALDKAIFKVTCAEHNRTAAETPDSELWSLNTLTSGDLYPGKRTGFIRREGAYRHVFNVSERQGFDSAGLPLPDDTFALMFSWREVFIPADDSEYTYSDFTESVSVAADTLLVATSEYAVSAPSTEGLVLAVTPPGRASAEWVDGATNSASKTRYGFLAYIQAFDATESAIYRVETASGSNDDMTFTGAQEVDADTGGLTNDFNADVMDTHYDRISTPHGDGMPSYDPRDTSPTATATTREWNDGMVLTLSEPMDADDIMEPVDDFVESAYGTEPFGAIDVTKFQNPHRVLMCGGMVYSRYRTQLKAGVTIPSALPFDITITVRWSLRIFDYSTRTWSDDEGEDDILIPAGDTSAEQSTFNEFDPALGTLVIVGNPVADPHPHIWQRGAAVTIDDV